MAVTAMSRLELYGLLRDLRAIMDLLQDSAVVEIETTEESTCYGERTAEDATRLEREIGELERLISMFDRYAPRHPNLVEQFAGIKTVLSEEEFERFAGDAGKIREVIEQAKAIEGELSALSARRHELAARVDQLRPWSELDLVFGELDGTKHVRLILGTAKLRDMDELAKAVQEADQRASVHVVAHDDVQARVAILWPRDAAFESLPSFNPVALPSYQGKIADELDKDQHELAVLDGKIAAENEQAKSFAGNRPRVEARLDHLRSELAKNHALMGLIESSRSFMLTGWVPTRAIERLRGDLERSGLPFAINTRPPEPGENAPVELRNTGPIVPFEALVQSFNYPQYDEIDPTPVTAPFFFIFFGFCLADAGYGVVLILFCLSLLKWLKMGPIGKKLSKLFIGGGVGAIIMGLLTGGIFGDLFGYKGLIDPINNALILLIAALALGVVQLFVGIVLSGLPSLRRGDWRDALFNQGMWLLFLISLMLLLGKGSLGLQRYGSYINYLALFSVLGVVYNGTRGKKGLLGKILGIPAGLFSIYNGVGFFSDVLSYSRLMALGLSSGVMAMIINLFARMVAGAGAGGGFSPMRVVGIIGGVAIGVFGHTLNIALAILGAYVHSSRLQFLEFYGKFFEGGGRPFRPLRKERKLTYVVKQKEA